MDLMTGIAAATKALVALKAIREIDKSLDAATWKAKVAELMGSVADMKLALIDANDSRAPRTMTLLTRVVSPCGSPAFQR
jgi:hypothetical protein